MNWVVNLFIGGLITTAVLNALVHIIFKLTGGKMDDGDYE